jgi:hypothetical protein
LAVVLAISVFVPASAAERFTLGKAVPEDVFVYAHFAHNPERDAINKKWSELWQAVADARFQDDVHQMIGQAVTDPLEKENFEAFWKKFGALLDGIEWSKLVSQEVVVAARLGDPLFEFVILMRGDADTTEANATGLKNVVQSLVDLSEGELTLTESKLHGASVATVDLPLPPQFSFRIQLARQGDVISVGASRELLGQCLGRLAGQGETKGLIESSRYKTALDKLPKAEDSVIFLDAESLFGGIRKMVDMAAAESGEDPDAKAVIATVHKAIDLLAIIDYAAATGTTDTAQTTMHQIAQLKPGAAASPLGKVLSGQKPFEKFDQYVPKEAGSFFTWSGIDPTAGYNLILDFVKHSVPDGADLITQWNDMQTESGFNVQAELFDWISGQMVVVSLPAAVPTPFSPDDSVLFVRVKDRAKARAQLERAIDKLQAMSAERQMMLMIADANVPGAEGFKSVTHPMLAMMLNPVIGVHGNEIVVGTSAQAIATCLATAEGKHPSIAENPRFGREGLAPKIPVYSVAFTDLSKLGTQIATGLGGANMGLGMAAAGAGQDPAAQAMLGGLTKMIAKIMPILAKLNFLSSSANVTVFDGQAWHTRAVTSYNLDAAPGQP